MRWNGCGSVKVSKGTLLGRFDGGTSLGMVVVLEARAGAIGDEVSGWAC